jgi:hypothetical protein
MVVEVNQDLIDSLVQNRKNNPQACYSLKKSTFQSLPQQVSPIKFQIN